MDQDKDFVIKIIQFLQNKYGIIFFITSKDFNSLYRWWEKRIPLRIIKESIANVVTRRQKKKMGIRSFSDFGYEVRKNFDAFLQLNVGSEGRETAEKETPAAEEKNPYEDIEGFFARFPTALEPLKHDFENLYQQLKSNQNPDLAGLRQKLPGLFSSDEELQVKTAIFLKSLAPGLRNSVIEQRYQWNYLVNKFNIPDFTLSDLETG